MATVNLTANTNQVTTALNQVNQQISNMATTSQTATSQIASGFESVKDITGKVIENYMNIKSVIEDLAGVYNDAFRRQAQWNTLLLSDSYKKYSEQINKMTEATNGMSDAYSNVSSLQKLFASGVDLSGEKLTQLTQVATAYANKMGVDVTEAIQRFSETIAEGTTSKLEDLGIYMDSEEAVMKYAIAHGIASKEIDETTKKQIILNELLNLQKPAIEGNVSTINKLSGTTREFRQHLDELIVGLGDTVGEGLMWIFNENARGSEYWGGKIYDLIHIFDEVPETIKGDVIPSVFSLSKSVDVFSSSINNAQKSLNNLGTSGIMAFKFVVASEIETLNKLQEQYEKAWQKQQETIDKNQMKKFDKKLKDYEKGVSDLKKSTQNISSQEELEDIFGSNADMRTEQFANTENDIYEIRKKNLENYNNWKIENIKAEYDEEKRMNEIYKSYMVDAANNIYDGLLNSRANFLQETIALSMQRAGAEIFNDGLQGLWQGGRWMLSPYPTMSAQGASMVAYSLAEMGAGLALGYAGKAAMPSSSSKEATTKETAAVDRQQNVPKNEKTDVYLYPNEKIWMRRLNESTKKLKNK